MDSFIGLGPWCWATGWGISVPFMLSFSNVITLAFCTQQMGSKKSKVYCTRPLRFYVQDWQRITSFSFFWSKEVTRPAQIQQKGKWLYTLMHRIAYTGKGGISNDHLCRQPKGRSHPLWGFICLQIRVTSTQIYRLRRFLATTEQKISTSQS